MTRETVPPTVVYSECLKLQDIADRLGCRLDGDGEIEIHRMSGIADAGPGDLTFFSNPKYAAELRATRASAVILSPDAAPAACAMLRHPQPYLAFAQAVELFADGWRPAVGAHPHAILGAGVQLGEGISDRSVRGGRRWHGDRGPDGRSTRTW